jgi:two-component system nitrate/nitrite response regulator NarP
MTSPQGQKPSPISVALADSNPLMLSALSEFFERDARFTLVATIASAELFLDMMARLPAAVGVVDWALPGLGGERLLDILRARPNAPRVLVYGPDGDMDMVRRAMAAGAAGFCPRSELPAKLNDVAYAIAQGQMVFPFLDVRALKHDPAGDLTARERALLSALARGLNNKDLGAELGISVNTVKFHLRNLYDKLGVNSRAQAMAFYYSSGGPTQERSS